MSILRLEFLILLVALDLLALSNCYTSHHLLRLSSSLRQSRIPRSSFSSLLFSTPPTREEEEKGKGEEAELTTVGSAEYYKGFFTSDLQDPSVNTSQRGDGLDQALKIGIYTTAFLSALVAVFLFSNGLL